MISLIKNIRNINHTLYMNHLLVIYAFLIPISGRAKAAAFFLIIIFFILRGNYYKYLKISFSNKIVQAFLFFFLIHYIWLLGTEHMLSAKSVISDMKYLLFPLLFLSFTDKRFSFRIITAFTLGMFYSEIVSYLIHFEIIPYSLNIFTYEIYDAPGVNDPTPFLDHSRYTVLLSLVISFFLYNLLSFKYNNIFKIIVTIFMITASINLFLIAGRIGYITFLVLLVFVLILNFKKKSIKPLLILFLFLSIFFTFSYNYSSTFKNRLEQSQRTLSILNNDNSNYQSSFGLRLGFWTYSTKVISENFWFGVGTGDQMDEVRSIIPEKHSYIKNLSHSHNELIKNFVQFGFIGFLFYLNIFYQVVKFKQENIYLKNILLITSLCIFVGTMTSILGSKTYLPLFAVIIAATTSKEYLLDTYLKINKKSFFLYAFFILFFLILAGLQ